MKDHELLKQKNKNKHNFKKKRAKIRHRMKPLPSVEELGLDDKSINEEVKEFYYGRDPKGRF